MCSGASSTSPQYSALRAIGGIYSLVGWLTVIGASLYGLYLARQAMDYGASLWAIVSFISPALAGVVIGLPMLAATDMVALIINLESRAQQTNGLLGKLISEVQREPLQGATGHPEVEARTPAKRLSELKELLRVGHISDEKYRHKRDEIIHGL